MTPARALNAFLHRYLDDGSTGTPRSLEAYQALFPGHEELIAEQYGVLDNPGDPSIGRKGTLDRVGPYRILRELGRGGQGVVYLAEDERIRRRVALKMLTGLGSLAPERVARFLREAEVASRLDHPGIATMYETGTDGGLPYIAMRYVEGETLAKWIESSRESTRGRRALDPRAIASIIEKAARALHAAHQAGVIHRDIKPGNILVTASDEPVILDFGLANDADGELATLTKTGDFFGTPAYMSPEQIETQQTRPDRRTDVWSLGATLYECLTLARPFDAPTREGLYRAILTTNPADALVLYPSLPGDLKVVLEAALEKDRGRRYQTALDLAEDLRRVRMHEPILAKPVSPLLRLRRWSERNPALATALVGLFIVLATGLTIALVLLAKSERERNAKEKAVGDKEIALGQMTAERNEKQGALIDYDRLGDLSRLQRLIAEADTLWSAESSKVGAMQRWVAQGSDLETRLAGHRVVLDRLRKAALPYTDEDRARDVAAESRAATSSASGSRESAERLTWKFEVTAEQFKHDTTAKLVADLATFLDPNPEKGLLAGMRRRLLFAENVQRETIDKHETRWADAIQSIADRKECPKYDGLKIQPQLGLIPIGRNPASGLWEFAHLQTTAPGTDSIPKRDNEGRLVVTESMGLVFVLLPGGTFKMGAVKPDEDQAPTDPNIDPEAGDDESPVTEIRLDPFFMSKYEMTQGQWRRLVGRNPSQYGPGENFGGKVVNLINPVEQVSWEDCDLWLGRLSLILPTEAQWEYAARGGTTTPRWTGLGTDGLAKAANLADAFCRQNGGSLNWKYDPWDDGYAVHAPVGSFGANLFGLHDVLGNVWEWCRDWWSGYDVTARQGDGLRNPSASHLRVFRGGSFSGFASSARSALRGSPLPGNRGGNLGIRPARSVDL